jgi:hypothetical protein
MQPEAGHPRQGGTPAGRGGIRSAAGAPLPLPLPLARERGRARAGRGTPVPRRCRNNHPAGMLFADSSVTAQGVLTTPKMRR